MVFVLPMENTIVFVAVSHAEAEGFLQVPVGEHLARWSYRDHSIGQEKHLVAEFSLVHVMGGDNYDSAPSALFINDAKNRLLTGHIQAR